MATTTNYGWTTPDDTALVKDGASAIRTLGSSVDTTTKALNPSTTLGDVEYRSSTANTNTRLGIGSTGQVLTVAGGVPSWATPASPSVSFAGVSIDNTTNALSISNGTNTKITFNREVFDAGGYASSGSTITIPTGKAGYYLIAAQTQFSDAGSGYRAFRIYKNGAEQTGYNWYAGTAPYMVINYVNYYAVGDTIEFYAQQNSGGSLNIYRNIDGYCYFTASYLGA
jgi:hypothetical protein